MYDYVPLIYLIAGALIGFLSNYLLEKMKRNYELKKATYFEALDVLTRGPTIYFFYKEWRDSYEKYKKESATDQYQDTDLKENKARLIYLKNVIEFYNESLAAHENAFKEWMMKFKVVSFKLGICGSKEVNDIVNKYHGAINRKDPIEAISKELMEAMRKELLKPWWKF